MTRMPLSSSAQKFSMMSTLMVVALISLHQACILRKSKSTPQQVQAETLQVNEEAELTACLGVQSNGVNFASHLGGFIALLERGVSPKVTAGGGSGALAATLLMSLMANPSLDGMILKEGALVLSKPHKAALILAATQDVIEAFSFFPSLARSQDAPRAIARLFYGMQTDAINAIGPNNAQLQTESMIGQAVVLANFLKTADFTRALALPSFSARRKAIKELWQKSSNALESNVGEILRALAPPSENSSEPERVRLFEISQRYLKIFREDHGEFGNLPITARERFSDGAEMLASWQREDQSTLAARIFQIAHDQHLPDTKSLEHFLARKVMVPDPNVLWLAYNSRTRTNDFIGLPKGLVVHATLREASTRPDQLTTKPTEISGWAHLYQAYLPSEELFERFVVRKNNGHRFTGKAQEAHDSFLPYRNQTGTETGTETGTATAIGNSNVLLLAERKAGQSAPRGLAFALRVSAAEPGTFRRILASVDEADKVLNPAMPQLLYGFGGWAEPLPLGSLMHLDECKNADYFFKSGLAVLGNSLNIPALKGALEGEAAFLRPLLPDDELARRDEELKSKSAQIEAVFAFSSELEGKKGRITNGTDWQETSTLPHSSQDRRTLSKVITGNRAALMFHAYQLTARSMDAQAFLAPGKRTRISAWGRPLEEDVASLGSAGEIELFLKSFE